MREITGMITLPLQQTHSIDLSKRELLATSVSSRTIKDSNYGGQGEKETTIPTIRNISWVGGIPSQLSSVASQAKNGGIDSSTGFVRFARLSATNIKGVQ